MDKILTAIIKLFLEIKRDRWWNIITKFAAWILLAAVIMHLYWWATGKHTKLWISEHNNFQPCTDTLVKHDTLWKYDTMRIPVSSNRLAPKNKTEGSHSPIIDAKGVKNLATGENGRAGDDYHFPSETLTEDQSLDILNKVSNYRIMNKLKKCIFLGHAPEASGRITYKIKKLLEENGYSVMMNGIYFVSSAPYTLMSNGDCVELIVGVFE